MKSKQWTVIRELKEQEDAMQRWDRVFQILLETSHESKQEEKENDNENCDLHESLNTQSSAQ